MKNLARLLALVLVVVMTLSLVGCGLNSKLKGEWVGKVEESGISIEITLKFDGKGEVAISAFGMEETSEYEVNGKKLIINDDEVDYELKGKTLTLDLDGMDVEFEKQ